MTFAKNLGREKTLPRAKGTTTFNASGVYTPIYGKTNHLISGRGTPGNPTTGGNPNGTNPSSPGTPGSQYWSVFYQTIVSQGGAPANYSSSGPNYGTSASTPASYVSNSYYADTDRYTSVYVDYHTISTTPANSPTTGNPKYNPIVPGNAGPTTTVFGVTFPGGAAGALAPSVAPTYVPIAYTPSGTPVTVPPGGFVNIQNL